MAFLWYLDNSSSVLTWIIHQRSLKHKPKFIYTLSVVYKCTGPIIIPWGTRFTSIFSVFSVMAGWIAEMPFMLILLCNEQNIAEYKAYWLMGVPVINP